MNWLGALLLALCPDFANEELPFWIHNEPIFVDILDGSSVPHKAG